MSDDTPRNLIEPEDPAGQMRAARERNPVDSAGSGDTAVSGDRGMPALGQYRRARPRAWWLTPLVIVIVAGVGAVWTVHGFMARHDAQAKAQRDVVAQASAQGRVFGAAPDAASAPLVASAPLASSAPLRAPAQGTVLERPAAPGIRAASTRSYYDAPLLVGGGMSDGDNGTVSEPSAGIDPGGNADASSVAAAMPGRTGASGVALVRDGTGGLEQALSPSTTPRVRATMLGSRSLMLAQGAKIDCAGDTAFDSTNAGLSTCTVTKNVYSDDGRVVLIERGSRISSQYRSHLSPGQKRAFILAARVETPQGVTVEIDSPAADALGRMGIDGYVDNHWGARLGAGMLLGMTQDAIGYLATRGGNSSGSVVYGNTQQQGNDMATRVLDNTINIPPTLSQNQGAEFAIVVARDLDFGSVYALQPEETP